MKKIPTLCKRTFLPLVPIQIVWKFTDQPRRGSNVLCYVMRKDYETGEMIVLWTLTVQDARLLVKWYRQERKLGLFFELKDNSLRLEISQQETPLGLQFDFKTGNSIHRLTVVELDEIIHYIEERLLDK